MCIAGSFAYYYKKREDSTGDDLTTSSALGESDSAERKSQVQLTSISLTNYSTPGFPTASENTKIWKVNRILSYLLECQVFVPNIWSLYYHHSSTVRLLCGMCVKCGVVCPSRRPQCWAERDPAPQTHVHSYPASAVAYKTNIPIQDKNQSKWLLPIN